MGNLTRDLLWCWQKHKGFRGTYMTPWGALKCWEVFPIIILCTGAITTYAAYFGLWFWHTRTDVQYRFFPPLQETMDFKNITQAKIKTTESYKTYRPETFAELAEIFKKIRCIEKQRMKC